MAFLLLKDIYNDVVRINIAHITSYIQVGEYTKLYVTSNTDPIEVQCNSSDIDQAIIESFAIFKNLIKEET